jgi:hypothetical protein
MLPRLCPVSQIAKQVGRSLCIKAARNSFDASRDIVRRDNGSLVMKEIRTEIEINAVAERLWRMLTDFAAYPEWNPFIVEISGEAREGARLTARLRPPGTRGWTFRPVILRADAPRELRWRGRLGLKYIFDGEHIFTIEAIAENRVRFVQREIFSGLLVPFLAHMLDDKTRQGFKDMNRWLKKRAEEQDADEKQDAKLKDERPPEETA